MIYIEQRWLRGGPQQRGQGTGHLRQHQSLPRRLAAILEVSGAQAYHPHQQHHPYRAGSHRTARPSLHPGPAVQARRSHRQQALRLRDRRDRCPAIHQAPR